MEDENLQRLLDALPPSRRAAFEAARAATKPEAEVVAEIDHDEPLDLTDAKVHVK